MGGSIPPKASNFKFYIMTTTNEIQKAEQESLVFRIVKKSLETGFTPDDLLALICPSLVEVLVQSKKSKNALEFIAYAVNETAKNGEDYYCESEFFDEVADIMIKTNQELDQYKEQKEVGKLYRKFR